MTWQPLETAPLDVPVWAASKCKKVFVTRWDKKRAAWSGFANREQPLGWQPYIVPVHPELEAA